MKLIGVDADLLQRALHGELLALDAVLVQIQPLVFNLAMRMLANRDDAHDATQEILLRVTTHLSSFRHEAKFETWVYRIATNQLLTARTKRAEAPTISFEQFADKLEYGMQFAQRNALDIDSEAIAPEDKFAAQELALSCTQGMLMCLDREHRIAYILDIVFGLASREAALVLNLTDAAYRKRLSRARERLQDFMQTHCALVGEKAPCQCATQARVQSHLRQAQPVIATPQSAQLRQFAKAEMLALTRMSDAAAVFRAHPQYQATDTMLATIRAVLKNHEQRWQ
jgi:RNA polymerase sigma factor (sigma-70 family)